MKNNNKKTKKDQLKFKGIKNKSVEVNFEGGNVTSDAGLILLRRVEEQTEFLRSISSCIEEKRHPSYTRHSIETIVKQRVFGIIGGYEDGNDHNELRKDAMLKIALNKDINEETDLSSPSTISRLENSVDREDLEKIASGFVEQFISGYSKPPKSLVLDFDATDDPVHGGQENRFFHGYYDSYIFLPLYVFCDRKLLVAYLRPGWIDAAKHAGPILKLLVKRLRQEWPKVKITFRADSGFCRKRILRWCEKENVKYIVGITGNNRIKTLAQDIIEESRKKKEIKPKKKIRLFGEISYKAESWTGKDRRVIVKAEQLEKGENIRYVITNIKTSKPKWLYDRLYTARGEMENRIKEQQLYLFADRTSCQDFEANQFRLFLSSAAYVVYEEFREKNLKGTKLEKAQCCTIRLKLVKIGAVIISNTRRIAYSGESCHPFRCKPATLSV